MDRTLVLVDEGFLSKLSKYFGEGKYLKFDKVKFCNDIADAQNLICEKIFYYTAPPLQSGKPTKEESNLYKKYRKFVRKISSDEILEVREGRCQRLKTDGEFIFKQKAVDILLAMDLTSVPLKFPNVKKIILIACDSDFVPVIKNLAEQSVKTILYTYYDKKRDTPFSRSNDLIKSVYKYVLLTKKDFENAKLK